MAYQQKGEQNLNDISTFLMSSTSFHFLYFFKRAEINLKNANFTLKLCLEPLDEA